MTRHLVANRGKWEEKETGKNERERLKADFWKEYGEGQNNGSIPRLLIALGRLLLSL
jgi:hypothetical protein